MAQDQSEVLYFPLNLPDGTVHGPFSFKGENVNLRWRNSLMILGTLHHHGSIRGFRTLLEVKLINIFIHQKYISSLPGIASWKGRVATHDEADQQSENDKFCLTLHVVLIVR